MGENVKVKRHPAAFLYIKSGMAAEILFPCYNIFISYYYSLKDSWSPHGDDEIYNRIRALSE